MAHGTPWNLAIAGLALLWAGAHPAVATIISPDDVTLTPLGELPDGNLTIDTGNNGDGASLPTLAFGGGTLTGDIISQAGGPEIAVFLFDGGAIFDSGSSLTATGGSRPIALLFNGSARIEGTINVSGGDGGDGVGGIPGNVIGTGANGTAGGGNGGTGGPFSSFQDGTGPGHGIAGSSSASGSGVGSGSGAGFGSDGGNGGAGPTNREGGDAYGDPLRDLLQGGSGGGGGGGQCCVGQNFGGGGGGGAGGGAIEIGALSELILAGAQIFANGGDGGNTQEKGAGGGGSGGGILLHAFDIEVDVNSLIQANGGEGGGCGGAGRVEAIANTAGSLSIAGTVEAVGFGACADLALVTAQLDGIGTPPDTRSSSSVPEPGMLAIFALGLAGLRLARGRRSIR